MPIDSIVGRILVRCMRRRVSGMTDVCLRKLVSFLAWPSDTSMHRRYVPQSLHPKVTGASHASELPFLFETLGARYGKDVTEQDRATAHVVDQCFAHFGKYGEPHGAGLPHWPTFDPARSDLMHFTPANGPVVGPDPWKERLDLVAERSCQPRRYVLAARDVPEERRHDVDA